MSSEFRTSREVRVGMCMCACALYKCPSVCVCMIVWVAVQLGPGSGFLVAWTDMLLLLVGLLL